MKKSASEFFESLKGKKTAFIGIGVSNAPLIEMFSQCGAQVTLCDKKTEDQLSEFLPMLKENRVALKLGEGYLSGLEADFIVRSPGVYFNSNEIQNCLRAGIPVTSEMELFFDLCPCKTIAVTGSDGKTTTTSLIAEILRKAGKTVHLGGNIGRALLPIVEEISPSDVAVVELSSFQLLSMRSSPDTAVITNLSPNHLDVHGSMEEYVGAKKNLLLHQDAFSRAVLNLDNEETCSMAPLVRGQLRFFSRKNQPEYGAFLGENGILCFSEKGKIIELFSASEILIPGVHNVENFLAAISALFGDVEPSVFADLARSFRGVPHRLELVRELGGVKYYNDSIATSPSRTAAGLAALKETIVLIAGGYDKKIPFEPLAEAVCGKVRVMILTGPTTEKIAAAVKNCKGLKLVRAANLEEATAAAKKEAKSGEAVLLSPACASFDSFKNFEERGSRFKSVVMSFES